MGIPIPRICFFERYKEKYIDVFRVRLFERNCDKCSISLRSVFDKNYNRPVWCDDCYKSFSIAHG